MFFSKVAVVTEGNKSTGKGICQMVAYEGANIAIVARDKYTKKLIKLRILPELNICL